MKNISQISDNFIRKVVRNPNDQNLTVLNRYIFNSTVNIAWGTYSDEFIHSVVEYPYPDKLELLHKLSKIKSSNGISLIDIKWGTYSDNFIKKVVRNPEDQDLTVLNWVVNQDIFKRMVNIKWGTYSDEFIEYITKNPDKSNLNLMIRIIGIKSTYGDPLLKIQWGTYNDKWINFLIVDVTKTNLSLLKQLIKIKFPSEPYLYISNIKWGTYSDQCINMILTEKSNQSVHLLVELLDIKSSDGNYLPDIAWGTYSDRLINLLTTDPMSGFDIALFTRIISTKSPKEIHLLDIKWGTYSNQCITILTELSDKISLHLLMEILDIKSSDGKYLPDIAWGTYNFKWNHLNQIELCMIENLLQIKSSSGQYLFSENAISVLQQQAYFKGMQQGIQQGMQQGIQQGMQQGMQQGIQQGMQQGIQQGIQLQQNFYFTTIKQSVEWSQVPTQCGGKPALHFNAPLPILNHVKVNIKDNEVDNILSNTNSFEPINNTTQISRASSPTFILGGSDFLEVLESDGYIDRTSLIIDLLDNRQVTNSVCLITAPRRFGKSMNMQMLKEFLGIEFNKDKKILQSSDTKIGKIINQIQNTKTIKAVENQGFFQAHFKKHHIIFIDFQNVKGDSIQEIQTLLRIEIRKLYNSHDYIIPILAKKAQSEEAVDGILKMFQKYNGHVPLESAEMKNSLFFLSEILHKYFDQPQALYNEKVIIMIDEYDTPINASVANSRIDEQTIDIIQSFFDSLLCTTFKGNEHLLLGIMTGISGMVRASGRSGLNNVTEFKFLSDFNTLQPYYFLNEEQVNFLLQTIELNSNQHVTRELKRYYNGYTDVLYNPWSVFKQSAYMLQNKENIEDKKFIFKSYWCKTGNISFVHQLFHFPIIKEIIIKLIQKEQYTFTLRDELNIDDLKILKQLTLGDQTMSMNNVIVDLFLSYIFELGYLTHDGQNNYKIPNEEIRQEFLEIMFYYFEKTYNLSITNMTQATRAFNTLLDAKNAQDRGYHMDNFKQLLNTLLNRVSFSQIKDSNEGIHPNEDLFHSLLNIIVWKSTKLIKFATEASSYNPLQPGRLDIVFITDHAIGGIIEVKYSDNLSASKIANVALTQINTKDYDYIFKTHHSKLVKNVFKIGIGFSNIINQHVDVQYIFNPLQETSLDNISARKSKKRKINDDNNSYEKMDFTQSQMMDKDIIQQNNGDITPSEEINVIGDTAIPNMF